MSKKRLAYKGAKIIFKVAFWSGRMREKAVPRMSKSRGKAWLPSLGAGFGGGLGGGLGAGALNNRNKRRSRYGKKNNKGKKSKNNR